MELLGGRVSSQLRPNTLFELTMTIFRDKFVVFLEVIYLWKFNTFSYYTKDTNC